MSWTSWGEHGVSVIREYEIPDEGGQGIIRQQFGVLGMTICTKGMGKGGRPGVAPGAGPPLGLVPPVVLAPLGLPLPLGVPVVLAPLGVPAVAKEGDFKRRKK